jgi:hypothetical protein
MSVRRHGPQKRVLRFERFWAAANVLSKQNTEPSASRILGGTYAQAHFANLSESESRRPFSFLAHF